MILGDCWEGWKTGCQGRYGVLEALVNAMVRYNTYETGKTLLDLNDLELHVTQDEKA